MRPINLMLCVAAILSICGGAKAQDIIGGEPFGCTTETLVVIDGQTIRCGQWVLRMENLDSPEPSKFGNAACLAESMLGNWAIEIGEGLIGRAETIEITPTGRRDDRARPLIRLTVNGRDWAEYMIEAEVATPWCGQQTDWCGTREPAC